MTEDQLADDIERFISDEGLEMPEPKKVYTEYGYYEETPFSQNENQKPKPPFLRGE